jgi:metallo-beta-lactamase family protein
VGAATVQLLGAAGTVTGSKHLVTVNGRRVLLDCGLFQGLKALRQRNWRPFPFEPASLDAVVLSHAHIDHSGALPLLVRRGFRGPIHCTPGTADLLEVLLLDAAHLQEEDAAFANRHRTSKHAPALPLYTTADARAALALVQPHPYDTPFAVADGVEALLRRSGHILGAASVTLSYGRSRRTLVFSGDLGRCGKVIMRDPSPVQEADVLLVESTYGDRVHPLGAADELARIVSETAARSEMMLVPAFAVDRTQELLYVLRALEEQGRIPVVPVFIDSPMAIDVTAIYARHPEDHDLDMRRLMEAGASPLATRHLELLRTPEESKSLNDRRGPAIVISASGMATGGRVLHHLMRLLPDPDATVLLVGYQAAGTRGRSLEDGAKTVRIFNQEITVRARIVKLDGFSAHADQEELLRWLRGFTRPPRRTLCVHGEPQAADTFAALIRHRLGWVAEVPEDRQCIELP